MAKHKMHRQMSKEPSQPHPCTKGMPSLGGHQGFRDKGLLLRALARGRHWWLSSKERKNPRGRDSILLRDVSCGELWRRESHRLQGWLPWLGILDRHGTPSHSCPSFGSIVWRSLGGLTGLRLWFLGKGLPQSSPLASQLRTQESCGVVHAKRSQEGEQAMTTNTTASSIQLLGR